MIVTAHQLLYLPGLRLFHKIALADQFCVFDVCQYERRSFENRNYIKTAHGKVCLTVPVKSSGHRQKLNHEIEINHDVPWQRKHWRTIELAYQRAPYWNDFKEAIAEWYEIHINYLYQLNEFIMGFFFGCFKMNQYSSLQFASFYHPLGTKSALVLDLCKKVKADAFVFGSQGRDYADVPAFEQAGIHVYFQDYHHPVYPQLHGAFIPNLSALDLLLNCGPDSLKYLMQGNITKEELCASWSRAPKATLVQP